LRSGGLRAGWRLLAWLAIFLGVAAVVSLVIIKVFHPRETAFLDPGPLILSDILVTFIPALVATLVMATVERRTLQDYYVPGYQVPNREPTGCVKGMRCVFAIHCRGERVRAVVVVGPTRRWCSQPR
jgi:hypothetical protein